MKKTTILVGILLLGLASPAVAHRLDEYLQATRISVEGNRISAEVNLTPGADVAEGVFAMIDGDRNGEVSKGEADAYLTAFLKSVSLVVDGKSHSLQLESYSVPSLADMRRGEGVLRLHAMAEVGSLPDGRHRLKFSNTHRADISVYLVNALIPKDERIKITGQSRDMLQREFDLDYSIADRESGISSAAAVLPPFLGLALAGVFYAVSRRLK